MEALTRASLEVSVVTELAWQKACSYRNSDGAVRQQEELGHIQFPNHIINAPKLQGRPPARHGCRQETVIALGFRRRKPDPDCRNTAYAGENKEIGLHAAELPCCPQRALNARCIVSGTNHAIDDPRRYRRCSLACRAPARPYASRVTPSRRSDRG